jgi:hypothetical protein
VTYDPTKTGPQKIAESISKTGFRATVKGHVGDAFARSLKLQGTAWDVYLVYDRNVRWDGADPPAPSFWMHQLQEKVGADQKLCLNPARLRREVASRVARR